MLTPVGLQDVHADALAAKTGTDMCQPDGPNHMSDMHQCHLIHSQRLPSMLPIAWGSRSLSNVQLAGRAKQWRQDSCFANRVIQYRDIIVQVNHSKVKTHRRKAYTKTHDTKRAKARACKSPEASHQLRPQLVVGLQIGLYKRTHCRGASCSLHQAAQHIHSCYSVH